MTDDEVKAKVREIESALKTASDAYLVSRPSEVEYRAAQARLRAALEKQQSDVVKPKVKQNKLLRWLSVIGIRSNSDEKQR